MPMVRDARVTGPISRAASHHEPVRAVDSISLPTFIELLKNHPLVREKKRFSFVYDGNVFTIVFSGSILAFHLPRVLLDGRERTISARRPPSQTPQVPRQ